MGRSYNEPWEQCDITAFASGIKGDGVVSGLAVTEKGTPDMGVAVGAGSCIIGGTTHTEASTFNLSIDNGHATHDRKDLIIYDASANNPAVVKGTAATPPVPPAIPNGDILLGVVLVEATESTSITNSDINEGRILIRTKYIRLVIVKSIADTAFLTTGDGKAHFTVPIELNGMNLVSVGGHVYTPSTSGLPNFQIHNLTDAVNMLSTPITIDANEKDSKDAAIVAVIDTSHDDVSTGDEIRFDCDGAGTGTKGMEIRLGFQDP